jgi:tRNA nucleotidyltransferase (CCA-adding enzyme)
MKPYAIICEGTTDRDFLKLLLTHCKISENQVDFYMMGNKSSFFKPENKKYRELLPKVQADQVERILFVINADCVANDRKYGGVENTQRELDLVIHEHDIKSISEVFISCDPETKTGYLESLILATIPAEQCGCIENFFNCSQFKSKENHKAIVNQIYSIAYPNAPYNFEHRYFDALKKKLQWLSLVERIT